MICELGMGNVVFLVACTSYLTLSCWGSCHLRRMVFVSITDLNSQ